MSEPDRPSIRIGHAERERAVQELGEHFAAGRLEPDEYEERVAQAYTARMSDELDRIFHDLPRPVADAPEPAPVAPGPAVPHPDPAAPYGREPVTGIPYSDRSKLLAGLLQIVLPIGVGRLYAGSTGIGVAQLLLSFIGIGVIWCFIDGIVILVGRPTDQYGRPLRT